MYSESACGIVSNEPSKSIIYPWKWPVKSMDRIHINYSEYDNYNFVDGRQS